MMKKMIFLSLLCTLPVYAGLGDRIAAARKAFSEEPDEVFTITNEGYKPYDNVYEKESAQDDESITVQLNDQPNKVTIRRLGKAVVKAKRGAILLFSTPGQTFSILTKKHNADTGTVQTYTFKDSSTTIKKNMHNIVVQIVVRATHKTAELCLTV